MSEDFNRGSVFSDELKRPARKGPPARKSSYDKKADDLDDIFGKDDPDIPKDRKGGRMRITPY